jgi:hypothetical protein
MNVSDADVQLSRIGMIPIPPFSFMLTGLSNKDGRIFFIKIVSHTFPDKEAHKSIIYEYILKLDITEWNSMEGF